MKIKLANNAVSHTINDNIVSISNTGASICYIIISGKLMILESGQRTTSLIDNVEFVTDLIDYIIIGYNDALVKLQSQGLPE